MYKPSRTTLYNSARSIIIKKNLSMRNLAHINSHSELISMVKTNEDYKTILLRIENINVKTGNGNTKRRPFKRHGKFTGRKVRYFCSTFYKLEKENKKKSLSSIPVKT